MKNILILEDDIFSQEWFGKIFRNSSQQNKINLFQAYNLKYAEKIFDKYNNVLDIVALDGNVPNEGSRFKNTVELAEYIRKNFNGTMLSISQDYGIRDEFKGKGFEILDFKFDLIDRVEDLLKI